MKNNIKITTRKQLRGYGATPYHAITLTKNLSPVGKQGRAYVYALNDVISSIKIYLKSSKIKPKTRQILTRILQNLLELISNVTVIACGQSTNPEISKLARQLLVAMNETDKALAELKASVATITTK